MIQSHDQSWKTSKHQITFSQFFENLRILFDWGRQKYGAHETAMIWYEQLAHVSPSADELFDAIGFVMATREPGIPPIKIVSDFILDCRRQVMQSEKPPEPEIPRIGDKQPGETDDDVEQRTKWARLVVLSEVWKDQGKSKFYMDLLDSGKPQNRSGFGDLIDKLPYVSHEEVMQFTELRMANGQ